jgi:hypothetical protein
MSVKNMALVLNLLAEDGILRRAIVKTAMNL